ncbi:hypothetical protein [Coxiella burnetii]|uniref:hypothetical protein n=1 Tax=Coxiella burnetii TaxID=777 RepID=UPI000593A773|nr:hypothetical protein [Coxiella burnetii]
MDHSTGKRILDEAETLFRYIAVKVETGDLTLLSINDELRQLESLWLGALNELPGNQNSLSNFESEMANYQEEIENYDLLMRYFDTYKQLEEAQNSKAVALTTGIMEAITVDFISGYASAVYLETPRAKYLPKYFQNETTAIVAAFGLNSILTTFFLKPKFSAGVRGLINFIKDCCTREKMPEELGNLDIVQELTEKQKKHFWQKFKSRLKNSLVSLLSLGSAAPLAAITYNEYEQKDRWFTGDTKYSRALVALLINTILNHKGIEVSLPFLTCCCSKRLSANEEAINNVKAIVKSNIESGFGTVLNQGVYLNRKTLSEIDNALDRNDALKLMFIAMQLAPMPLKISPTQKNTRNVISLPWASTITLALTGYYWDTEKSLDALTKNPVAAWFFTTNSSPPFTLLYGFVIYGLLANLYNSLFLESHDLRASLRSVRKSWNERTSFLGFLAENSKLLKLLSSPALLYLAMHSPATCLFLNAKALGEKLSQAFYWYWPTVINNVLVNSFSVFPVLGSVLTNASRIFFPSEITLERHRKLEKIQEEA